MITILAQAVDPVSATLSPLLEQYGLPGLVIFIFAFMLWNQGKNHNKQLDELLQRVQLADKRSGIIEDSFMAKQNAIELELRQTLTAKDQRATYLETQLVEQQKQLTEITKQANVLRSTLDNLRDASEKEQRSLRDKVRDLEQQLDVIVKLNDNLALENARLLVTDKDQKALIKRHEDEVKSLQGQITSLKQRVEELQTALDSKNSELKELLRRVDKIETKEIKDPTT